MSISKVLSNVPSPAVFEPTPHLPFYKRVLGSEDDIPLLRVIHDHTFPFFPFFDC